MLNIVSLLIHGLSFNKRTNIIHMTTYLSRRLNVLCLMFKIIVLFYNNAVFPAICEGWHVTHTWKALARSPYFTH